VFFPGEGNRLAALAGQGGGRGTETHGEGHLGSENQGQVSRARAGKTSKKRGGNQRPNLKTRGSLKPGQGILGGRKGGKGGEKSVVANTYKNGKKGD